MSSDARIDHRVKPKPAKDVFHGLWAVPIAWLMASSVAAAQENPNPSGSSSTTTLPEIHVIATTPVAPPRVAPRGPAAAAAPTPTTTANAPRRPLRNPYLAWSNWIKSLPTSRRLELPLLMARRRRIFCNRWSERCPACP